MALTPRINLGIFTALAILMAFESRTHAAVVLLSTDFAGRTVSGKTANNITWSQNGMTTSTSLTAVDEAPTAAAFTALFDTANAQGHFAPDKNTGNEGPWSATMTLSVISSPISLEEIQIGWQHFSNTGAFQGPGRGVRWTVTVTGSSSGLLDTVIGSDTAVSGTKTLTFISPLSLNSSETYDVKIFVDNNGDTQGNNTGFSSLSFNGTIVPEPSSVILVALSSLLLVVRRR